MARLTSLSSARFARHGSWRSMAHGSWRNKNLLLLLPRHMAPHPFYYLFLFIGVKLYQPLHAYRCLSFSLPLKTPFTIRYTLDVSSKILLLSLRKRPPSTYVLSYELQAFLFTLIINYIRDRDNCCCLALIILFVYLLFLWLMFPLLFCLLLKYTCSVIQRSWLGALVIACV